MYGVHLVVSFGLFKSSVSLNYKLIRNRVCADISTLDPNACPKLSLTPACSHGIRPVTAGSYDFMMKLKS